MVEIMHMRHKFDVDTRLMMVRRRPMKKLQKTIPCTELFMLAISLQKCLLGVEGDLATPLLVKREKEMLRPSSLCVVTSAYLHCHFHALGAGLIEDICIQRDKGFVFIRYNSHTEAAQAIQLGNTRILFDKPVKGKLSVIA